VNVTAPQYITAVLQWLDRAPTVASTAVFGNQPMPRGSRPTTATVRIRLGAFIEVSVSPQVEFPGDREVAQWLRTGTIRLPRNLAVTWFRRLQAAYGLPYDPVGPVAAGSATSYPSELTNLDEVQRLRKESDLVAASVDEDRLLVFLKARVRGQDHAIKTLANRVARHLAKTAPRRPLVIMFCGPTGVGKTRTALELAEAIRDQMPRGRSLGFCRLDMNQYQERHRISELLGAPAGYVGYGDGSLLLDQLASNPRSVVLFDEFEKADRSLWFALMNAFDSGRLVSPARTQNGTREVSCREAIFVLTTNLEPQRIISEIGNMNAFDDAATTDHVCRTVLMSIGVAPELIGRVGCFLAFKPLEDRAMAEVVTLAIQNVAYEYGIKVAEVEPAVVAAVLDRIACQAFGARPFENGIDEMLGRVFHNAVVQGLCQPVKVLAGPPMACVPGGAVQDRSAPKGEDVNDTSAGSEHPADEPPDDKPASGESRSA